MKRFHVELIGDGLKGRKRTTNEIVYNDYLKGFSQKTNKSHCMLAKQYPADTDIFELERKFRKIINGATSVDWALLDDGSYLAVKRTKKSNNNIYNAFIELGFEEVVL